LYSDRAAIAVLGPTRYSEGAAERGEKTAIALGASLAMTGYSVVVHDAGATALACARGARQHDGVVLAIHALGSEFPVTGVTSEVNGTLLRGLGRVLEVADAVIILPGDVRALALMTLVWSWGGEPDAPFRQIVLVGETWPETVRLLADAAGLDQKTRAMVTFAPGPAEAVETLRYYIAPTPNA